MTGIADSTKRMRTGIKVTLAGLVLCAAAAAQADIPRGGSLQCTNIVSTDGGVTPSVASATVEWSLNNGASWLPLASDSTWGTCTGSTGEAHNALQPALANAWRLVITITSGVGVGTKTTIDTSFTPGHKPRISDRFLFFGGTAVFKMGSKVF